MEKTPTLLNPEDTAEAHLSEPSQETPVNQETVQEELKWDTSPETALHVVADLNGEVSAVRGIAELDERVFWREYEAARREIDDKTKQVEEQKTDVEILVNDLLSDRYEEAEIDGRLEDIKGGLEKMEKLSAETGMLSAKLQDLVSQRGGNAFTNMRRLNDLRGHFGEYLRAVLEDNTSDDGREAVERVSLEAEAAVERLEALWGELNTINSSTSGSRSALRGGQRKIQDARQSFLEARAIMVASKVSKGKPVDKEALKRIRGTLKYGHTDDLDLEWSPAADTRAA